MKIAVLGFGTVGSGVYELVRDNKEIISKNAGEEVSTKYILDIRDFSDRPDAQLFTKNFDDIVNDDEVSIVVETIGGLEPAFTFSKKALEKGKTVITSNKELVATHGNELIDLAIKNGAKYLFEASVGGGIPIIRPLFHCIVSNQIEGVSGILNGTTNYILTKMFKNGESFEAALLAAQQNGYAERDPSADVDGHDTCKKICILSSIISGKSVDFKNVYTEGISKITLEDTKYAQEMGYSIKLIGECKRKNSDNLEVHVAPMLVSKEKMLSAIEDVYNGIVVNGGVTGDTMNYGRGAGKMPTASAVVADVVEAVKNQTVSYMRPWEKAEKNIVINHNEYVRSFFVRVKSEGYDKTVLSKILQSKEIYDGEIGFITEKISYQDICKKLSESGLQVVSLIEVMD